MLKFCKQNNFFVSTFLTASNKQDKLFVNVIIFYITGLITIIRSCFISARIIIYFYIKSYWLTVHYEDSMYTVVIIGFTCAVLLFV